MKVNIKKILESVVRGSSERAGCCDGDDVRLQEMIRLAKSKSEQDHKILYRLVFDAAD